MDESSGLNAEGGSGGVSDDRVSLSADNNDTTESDSTSGQEGLSAAISEENAMETLRDLFTKSFNIAGENDGEPKEKIQSLLDELTLSAVASYILSDKCKNVIVMCGAGISTAAGIPDFRSPGSGLYDNLQKYNLPSPQAIFEINFFKRQPEPFFQLARELLPGKFKPTLSHYFVKLLHDKNKLMRVYTQNIDILERLCGIPDDKIIEAHGTFFTSHCINPDCVKLYNLDWMKEKILKSENSVPKCEDCGELVKPDIVFFGQPLPSKFFEGMNNDFPSCDLLIIMGTSLVVQPFASLVDRVPETTPRLLINREMTGQSNPLMMLFGFGGGLNFDSEDNYRDVAYLGTCDEGCVEFSQLLGWKEELEKIYKADHKRIDEEENKFSASIGESSVETGPSKDMKPQAISPPTKPQATSSPSPTKTPVKKTPQKPTSKTTPTASQKPKSSTPSQTKKTSFKKIK